MSSAALLVAIGVGVLAELIVYALMRTLVRLDGKSAALAVGLLALLVYVPWAILRWPGADVFAIHLAVFLTFAYALGMLGGRARRRWHWAPVAIVAFFVVVIATNLVYLGVAEHGISGLFAGLLPAARGPGVVDPHFPGTVSHDFQEKEALYNDYLRQVESQKALGWQVTNGWRRRPVARRPAVFIVRVEDRDGVPVSGAEVRGEFLRTSNEGDDFDFAMAEVAPGEYRSTLKMPLRGLWRLVLQVRRGGDLHRIMASTTVAAGDGTR